jgi:hypothetical protein
VEVRHKIEKKWVVVVLSQISIRLAVKNDSKNALMVCYRTNVELYLPKYKKHSKVVYFSTPKKISVDIVEMKYKI